MNKTYKSYSMRKILNKVIMTLLIGCIFPLFITACGPASTDKPLGSNPQGNNSLASGNGEENTASLDGTLEVHFIDVGQADAILVRQGDKAMMVDGGNGDDEKALKSYLESQKITELQYVIGTHAHEDHIGSLDYIINSFKVGKIYLPKQTASTKTFENLVNAAKNKGLNFTIPKAGSSFMLGDAICTIIAPNGSDYSDTNDYSIVLKIEYGNTSFLLTGDAEALSEKEILSKSLDISSTVLKVGHHGSKTSTSLDFLSAVNPKYAVVSAGVDNKYNHPSLEVMERLKGKSIPVYRTDESGTIVAISNGEAVTFNVQPGSYEGMHTDSQGNSSSNNASNSSSPLVYWTSSGKVYHKDKNCSSLSRSTNILEGTLEDCPRTEACSVCAK